MNEYTTLPRILIIDDDLVLLRTWKRFLKRHEVYTASTITEGWDICREIEPDTVILDVVLPDGNGLDLIHKIHNFNSNIPVLITTGQRDMHIAAEAVKKGAYDFLAKPVDPEKLKVTVHRAVEAYKLASEINRLRLESTLEANLGLDGIIAESKVMQEVMNHMYSVAKRNSTVLLLGPSGVGKSSLARLLHNMSNRKDKSFVEVNLPTISEGVLEAQLFGHVKGAYTGAIKSQKGLFELGNGGTVFLDEIGDIPPNIQVKLLQVLQDGTFYPVGSNSPVKVDVRIIAATVRDLRQRVEEGKFREDLFYRLNVFPITVPTLKERKNEIPALAHHFLVKYCQKESLPLKRMSSSFIHQLLQHDWPGNIRELANTIEYAITVSKNETELTGEELQGYYLFKKNKQKNKTGVQNTANTPNTEDCSLPIIGEDFNLDNYIDSITKKIITYALAKENGNISNTSKSLGITRRRLGLLMKKLNIKSSSTKGRPQKI